MPTYRFQCSQCGLNFTLRAAAGTEVVPCAACGTASPRELPQSFHTGHTGPAGSPLPSPPATGFAGVDYNADRVIGEDARAKWEIIQQRQHDKVDLIHASGATGFDLSRKEDGSYRLMRPEERARKEKTRDHHLRALQQEMLRRKSSGPGR